MSVKKYQRIMWLMGGFIAVLLLTAACRAQTTMQVSTNSIVVKSVQVVSNSHIEFTGQTTLPDDVCLLTRLSADDSPEAWWPDDVCAVVESSEWHINVQLGNNEVPQDLSKEKQYVLRVWERDNPSLVAEPFWFDLSGPPESGE
jgi:hypothetical protein